MGARALYLGATVYRTSIASSAPTRRRPSGTRCRRAASALVNDEIVDLYERVPVGTKAIVQQ
jgi:hypothetical protein